MSMAKVTVVIYLLFHLILVDTLPGDFKSPIGGRDFISE